MQITALEVLKHFFLVNTNVILESQNELDY